MMRVVHCHTAWPVYALPVNNKETPVSHFRKAGPETAGAVLVACCAALLTGAIAIRAEQGPPAQAGARPLVPMTASSILRDPKAHVGENVSMMATVEAILSRTAFVMDQDRSKSTGQEVLVLAPTLTAPPDINSYVTVQGEVFLFDPAEVAKKARAYKLDLTPEQLAKYHGRPAVLATVVITPALVDLAKRPIPPPTPDDIVLGGHMRAINPAFTAVRGGLDKPDAAQIKEQLAAIRKAFAEVETFFKGKSMTDAMKWSADSLKIVAAMEQSAAGAKWDELKASAGSLQQTCAACHAQHRERMEDGSYRLKTGG